VKCLFFVYIKVVILIFINAAAMVELGLVSAHAHVKGSGREDIHVDGSASARDPPVEFETAPTHEITVCDVALVSCRTGAIDHDDVYDLLMECLQDVCFVLFVLYLLAACYSVSNFHLFSN
jgi:uncharacterized protein YcfL